MTSTKRIRFRLLGLAAAVIAALALTASAASAATPTPAPTGTASPLSLAPFHLRPEAFIVTASTVNPGGHVVAVGPVRGVGTGNLDNPLPDVWRLSGPFGHVNVLHSRIGAPVVDPATCTGSLTQTVRWAFLGGRFADARAFGFGTAEVTIREVLARNRDGSCGPVLFAQLVGLGHGVAARLPLRLRAPLLSPRLIPVS